MLYLRVLGGGMRGDAQRSDRGGYLMADVTHTPELLLADARDGHLTLLRPRGFHGLQISCFVDLGKRCEMGFRSLHAES